MEKLTEQSTHCICACACTAVCVLHDIPAKLFVGCTCIYYIPCSVSWIYSRECLPHVYITRLAFLCKCACIRISPRTCTCTRRAKIKIEERQLKSKSENPNRRARIKHEERESKSKSKSAKCTNGPPYVSRFALRVSHFNLVGGKIHV